MSQQKYQYHLSQFLAIYPTGKSASEHLTMMHSIQRRGLYTPSKEELALIAACTAGRVEPTRVKAESAGVMASPGEGDRRGRSDTVFTDAIDKRLGTL